MTEDNVLPRNPDVRLHNRITMTLKIFPASLIYIHSDSNTMYNTVQGHLKRHKTGIMTKLDQTIEVRLSVGK